MTAKNLLVSILNCGLHFYFKQKARNRRTTVPIKKAPASSSQSRSLPLAQPAKEDRSFLPKQIIMTSAFWSALYLHLIRPTQDGSHPDEQLAFILTSTKKTPLGDSLLAHEMIPATPADFAYQSARGLELKPQFVSTMLHRCRKEGWSLIEVHSHPFDHSERTTFSSIDWKNDREKMPALASILDEPFSHATMVVGQNVLDAHFYERQSRQILPIDRVLIVGHTLQSILTTSGDRSRTPDTAEERYQRQELFFGRTTQKKLSQTTVAIVGLGGLGSFAALELAHLGIGHLVLVDPDRVEHTNLNRLLMTRVEDIQQLKVDVYARLVREIAEKIQVTALPLSLTDRDDRTALEYVKGADVIFSCVDNDGTRLILNQIALRYLVPLIDGGSGIQPSDEARGTLASAGGQAQVVLPGLGCLECRGVIDSQRAYFDLATKEVQAEELAHGYGTQETAPSVIFLNGVIASLQVAELMYLLASARLKEKGIPPLSMYEALKRKVTPAVVHYNEHCPSCGTEGLVGVGDLVPIEFASSSPVGEPIPDATKH